MTTTPDPRHTLPATTARLLSLASRAPSIANSQPWLWRTDGAAVELYADVRRQLRADDPRGRQLMVSCGAAVHHLGVAAAALGLRPRVERVPVRSGDRPLVARVVLPGCPTEVQEHEASRSPHGSAPDVLAAIQGRRTDRTRFTTWPVPVDRVASLARAAASQGAGALPVVDAVDKARLSSLVLAAADTGSREGRRPADAPGDLEHTDGALVLYGGEDDADDWVTAGMGLSALWLEAARSGLGVVPLSAPVENDGTHRLIRQGILEDRGAPVLVVRVSWAPIGRGHLPGTSRHPWHEHLEVAGTDGRPTTGGDQGPRRLGAADSPAGTRTAAQ